MHVRQGWERMGVECEGEGECACGCMAGPAGNVRHVYVFAAGLLGVTFNACAAAGMSAL